MHHELGVLTIPCGRREVQRPAENPDSTFDAQQGSPDCRHFLRALVPEPLYKKLRLECPGLRDASNKP
jgi:hypothetical protein